MKQFSVEKPIGTVKIRVPEVEKLLGIVRTQEILAEEARVAAEKAEVVKQKRAEMDALKAEIEKEFNTDNAEKPEGYFPLHGEKIYLDGRNVEIYGGGRWFRIEEDAIWRIRNNGGDGDCWAWNNVQTGGAGAIGWKFERTQERVDLLHRWLEMTGNYD